jgi:hypothetical protein
VTAASFALVFGILYLGIGMLGLMPGMVVPPPPEAAAVGFDVMHGYLFGLFPVNMLHSLLHLTVGAWGLIASMAWAEPRFYARSLAVIFGALGVFGLIPGLNTLFGLLPLHGHDVWLHFGTAAVAVWAGFFDVQPAERRRGIRDRRRRGRIPVPNERRQGLYDRRRQPFPS